MKSNRLTEENNILQKFKEKHLERKERAKENKNVADHFQEKVAPPDWQVM